MSFDMTGIIDHSSYIYGHGIISQNCFAQLYSEAGFKIQLVCSGTFVQVHSIKDDDVLFCIVRDDMQVDMNEMVCKKADIISVPESLWGPLFTVKKVARLSLVKNREIAESIGNIAVGHVVQVLGPENSIVCTAKVTFRNSISRLGVGIYFGLQVMNPRENLQAIIQKVSLLSPGTKGFPRGCDLVVSIDKILPNNHSASKENHICCYDKEYRKQTVKHVSVGDDGASECFKSVIACSIKDKHNNSCKKDKQGQSSSTEAKLSNCQLKKTINSEASFNIGDEVVYLDGDTPEKGLVKWIGLIDDSLKVEVEFDDPVGSGGGNAGGLGGEMFRARADHILMVSPVALIKLSDYLMNTSRESICYNNNNNNNTDHNVCNSNGNINDNLVTNCLKTSVKINYNNNTSNSSSNNINKISNGSSSNNNNNNNNNNISSGGSSNNINNNKTGPIKQERSHRAHLHSLKKTQKSEWEDDFLFHEKRQAHSSEKNLRASIEREAEKHAENSGSEENVTNHSNSSKPSLSSTLSPEDLGKGSVVELTFKGEPHFGVIRWIGTLPDEEDCPRRLIAGIEMEEEYPGFTDGTFNNKRYFHCNPKKALFVPLSKCKKDSRFLEDSLKQTAAKINYGQIDCPIVEGTIPPINRKGDIESICGKNRGIQGHHNSCYLDATLFSMFAFTSVFDSLLYRPPNKFDIPQYSEVQRVLREEIVNPLRKNLYVRADRVMKLRTLLEKLSSVSGLTSEEKDPEEFLNSLLAQILKAEPFLKLSSGQEAFHYQLFVEKDERLVLPSVQQLFEQSFVTSDIKLKQVPSCLIIQMPRFGKSFKMYSRILPPQLLDVTDIIENSPRQCTVCGKLAEYECKDCFGQHGIGNGLESISFCKTCLDTAHNHHCRNRHNSRALTVPVEFYELQEHCVIPRLYMELFAVVCIETSHYVAFVKCGSGSDAPWCFFDSMADRKGEQNGYNIPEMVPCPDLPYWLSEDGAKMLNEMRDEHQLTEHAKRLFSDAYMCMYQSPELMMYR